MNRYVMVTLAFAQGLLGCTETRAGTIDAAAFDSGRFDASHAELVDGGLDAREEDVADAGDALLDASEIDADAPDAADGDAGSDSGVDAGIDGASDAGMDGGTDGGVDSGVDAGPPGPPETPVGAAVDITEANCAVDDAGHFWCWGRYGWEAEADALLLPRWFGSGFVSAAGTCALRADGSTWCANAERPVSGAVPAGVMYEAPGLVLDRLAKGSGFSSRSSEYGVMSVCGWRGSEVRCYHSTRGLYSYDCRVTTTDIPRECADVVVRQSVAGARPEGVLAFDGTGGVAFDLFDGTCRSKPGATTDCGSYQIGRAGENDRRLWLQNDCAWVTDRVRCQRRDSFWQTTVITDLVDYEVTLLQGNAHLCAYADFGLWCYRTHTTGVVQVQW
jgi:hypothetical protein